MNLQEKFKDSENNYVEDEEKFINNYIENKVNTIISNAHKRSLEKTEPTKLFMKNDNGEIEERTNCIYNATECYVPDLGKNVQTTGNSTWFHDAKRGKVHEKMGFERRTDFENMKPGDIYQVYSPETNRYSHATIVNSKIGKYGHFTSNGSDGKDEYKPNEDRFIKDNDCYYRYIGTPEQREQWKKEARKEIANRNADYLLNRQKAIDENMIKSFVEYKNTDEQLKRIKEVTNNIHKKDRNELHKQKIKHQLRLDI